MIALVAYIATIFGANWAIENFGFVPVVPDAVGLELMAPAGVYFAGLALVLRDRVQEVLGRKWVVGAILVGAGASYFVSPVFAVASAVAFLVSELADFSVYTPLRKKTLAGGVAASQLVGAAVDSALFLFLAFGSLAFFWGQFVGKSWMAIPALLVIAGIRARRAYRLA